MEEPEEDVTFIDQKALNRLERIPSNRWKTKKSTFAIRAIAFHFFRQKDIRLEEWFRYFSEFFEKTGIVPHMGHVRGQAYGYPRLCITYKGLKRKLAKYGFAPPDVCCVIVLNQKGIETQMMEDIVARSGIYAGTSSYMRTQPENYLESHATFLIDERVFPFRPEEFLKIAGALQNFIGAKYGYCYRTPDRCDPGSYPYFSDHVSVRKSDLDRSGKWYSFLSSRYEDPDEKALTAIRDIYRLNFLSREHLAIDAGGIPFGEWIKADPSRGTLKPVPGNENIYCWDIGDESLIPAISSTLAPFGFVISV